MPQSVRLTVVDPGKAPTAIVVSPSDLQLTAKPGEVLQFTLTIKLGPGASGADQLTAEAKPLSMADGTTSDCTPEFRWASGNAVTTAGRAILQGYLVGPSKPGTYRSEIAIKACGRGSPGRNCSTLTRVGFVKINCS